MIECTIETLHRPNLNNYSTLNFGELLFHLPQNNVKSIRALEKLKIKIIKEKYVLLFNKTCIDEGMIPKYIYIYI